MMQNDANSLIYIDKIKRLDSFEKLKLARTLCLLKSLFQNKFVQTCKKFLQKVAQILRNLKLKYLQKICNNTDVAF